MTGFRKCLLQKEYLLALVYTETQTETELLTGGMEEINEANR